MLHKRKKTLSCSVYELSALAEIACLGYNSLSFKDLFLKLHRWIQRDNTSSLLYELYALSELSKMVLILFIIVTAHLRTFLCLILLLYLVGPVGGWLGEAKVLCILRHQASN